MRTHTTRPAAVLAWVLGIALILACPQIVAVTIASVTWTLTAPAGAVVLAIAFVSTVGWLLVRPGRMRGWA